MSRQADGKWCKGLTLFSYTIQHLRRPGHWWALMPSTAKLGVSYGWYQVTTRDWQGYTHRYTDANLYPYPPVPGPLPYPRVWVQCMSPRVQTLHGFTPGYVWSYSTTNTCMYYILVDMVPLTLLLLCWHHSGCHCCIMAASSSSHCDIGHASCLLVIGHTSHVCWRNGRVSMWNKATTHPNLLRLT